MKILSLLVLLLAQPLASAFAASAPATLPAEEIVKQASIYESRGENRPEGKST
jgi:hypothetical protein